MRHPWNAYILLVCFISSVTWARADENLESLKRDLESLRRRVEVLEQENGRLKKEIDVDRLVVRKELVVSDTGQAWERGYEAQQIPRGIYARSLGDGPGGLWVRSRLIKGEIDDPFDDRFHALEANGSLRRTPGHISWNIWVQGAWRQMSIIQGESLEPTEMAPDLLTGGNHPGRLRFQTFRPHHPEPLTDALIGQGMMSLGGGGYGGGGLPYAAETLQIWGGRVVETVMGVPNAPRVISDDGTGKRQYSVVAVGAQGIRSLASATTVAQGKARLLWDSVPGADAYIILSDGREVTSLLRIEGSNKEWVDR